ncbi:hypothetical protein AVEN_260003-1 [Araneus ventricosus]|uniref:Uncharacterized protein n=1 Tax=Araneus ventricosus TaxID=182803 RepID=A0A4Y2H4T9_ARAVE|nr:hypothetical protein AVEN_260003-1 [Araneus ventricosus]
MILHSYNLTLDMFLYLVLHFFLSFLHSLLSGSHLCPSSFFTSPACSAFTSDIMANSFSKFSPIALVKGLVSVIHRKTKHPASDTSVSKIAWRVYVNVVQQAG